MISCLEISTFLEGATLEQSVIITDADYSGYLLWKDSFLLSTGGAVSSFTISSFAAHIAGVGVCAGVIDIFPPFHVRDLFTTFLVHLHCGNLGIAFIQWIDFCCFGWWYPEHIRLFLHCSSLAVAAFCTCDLCIRGQNYIFYPCVIYSLYFDCCD